MRKLVLVTLLCDWRGFCIQPGGRSGTTGHLDGL
jgi:hypothetical protein